MTKGKQNLLAFRDYVYMSDPFRRNPVYPWIDCHNLKNMIKKYTEGLQDLSVGTMCKCRQKEHAPEYPEAPYPTIKTMIGTDTVSQCIWSSTAHEQFAWR